MLLDVRLSGINGLDVLRIVKENYSLHRAHHDLGRHRDRSGRAGNEARRVSLHHERFRLRRAALPVRNASERQDLNRQVMTLSAQVAEQSDKEFLIGPSRVMRDIVDLVHKVLLSATVLILGESGTARNSSRVCCTRIGPRRGAVHHGQPTRFRTNWQRARSSATRKAHSPARTGSSSGSSSSRRAARCSR